MNQPIPIRTSATNLPALIIAEGEQAAERFIDFFTSNIRNRHTREAYGRAVNEFLRWCEAHRVRSLTEVKSLHVADLDRGAGARSFGAHREAAARRHPPSL